MRGPKLWKVRVMELPSVGMEGQARPGRFGPPLFLAGFSLIGLGVLLESWVTYHYLTQPYDSPFVQLQTTLFEWAIVNSILIGSGALLAAIGWMVWDRSRTKVTGATVPTSVLPSGVGFVLVGLGAAMIAGEEYFNAVTTYAALRGSPWNLPNWVSFGAFSYAMLGGGLVLIGAGWFARSVR
jgi:hypothetical protein